MEDKATHESTRFFCLGKELKNEFFLYSYDIVDEMVIQGMVKELKKDA